MFAPHVSPERIACAERFQAQFHAARLGPLAAMPGNPYGVVIRPFGDAEGVACKVRHPLLRGKNRIHGFRPDDIGSLASLLDFYRADGLRCTLSVPHGQMTRELFLRLAEAGLWSAGSGSVPCLSPKRCADCVAPPAPPDIHVRPSGAEEKELYQGLFQQAFADHSERDPEYRAIQWAEDSLPGGRRYVAEIDGRPVGMASFTVVEGVGFLGTAGVLPTYRGRGVHMALIRRRLVDAPDLGCILILGGNSPGTTPFRNFERAGLRLLPMGMGWRDGRD